MVMLKGLSHTMMYVHDVERAQRFYVDVLGFAAAFSSPHYAMLHHPSGARMDLHPTKEPLGRAGSPYFLVDDIDQAVSSLRAAGVEVQGPRAEGGAPRFAVFKDPEGNELGFTEASPR